MAVNSFKQMIKDKTIKRNDGGMLIRLRDIHIKADFNKRIDDERTRLADEETFEFLNNGGKVPALEVTARAEGGVWVVEGHRRVRAFRRCRDAGKPVEWISITQFIGNDVERLARIVTSNNQLPLTQLEQSLVVKELLAFNLSPGEIAKLISKSRAHVDKLLVLANSNHDVQTMVKEGTVAVDVAVDRVRKHGESATEVLSDDVARAKAAGKTKVTRSVITPTFDIKKAKQLVGLLSQSESRTIDDVGYLMPRFGVIPLVMKLLDELNGTEHNNA